MAPPPGTLRVGRYFLALVGLLAVLYALILLPGERHTPKLGIDLVGGVRVVFTAITPHGSAPPSSAQMSQARQIMEDRINTYGVTGATVVVQGGDQLVIEIPAGTGADVQRLGKAAILNFRGVMAPAQPILCVGKSPVGGVQFQVPASNTVTPAAVQQAFDSAKVSIAGRAREIGSGAKRVVAADVRNTQTTDVTSAQQKTIATALAKSLGIKQSDVHNGPLCAADPFRSVINAQTSASDKQKLTSLLAPSLEKHEVGLNAEKCPSPSMPDVLNNPAPCHAFSDLTSAQQQQVTAALQNFQCSSAQAEADIPYNFYIACDTTNSHAFLLSHVIVHGQQISSAAAQAPNSGSIGGSLEWTVALKLHSSGANAWHAWTSQYNYPQAQSSNANVTPLQTPGSTSPPCGPSATLVCSNFVAFTLDGQVISFPVTLAVLDVNTSISGNFTQSTAEELAKELNYGKLPLNFRPEAIQHVSATLGSTQLKAAFLAGGIGLALVIIYSLLYYRALGLVTISSLVVSGLLTYAMLVILSKQIGFTLDLAGIAGFIVALGITADSFVVFFERIKDEVHEGRSMRVAVPRAWVRARRTILSADTVSFLAAAILYYFASADVKGFAFTLGMSTILDLVVVFLFTHPMVSLLSRMPAFGSGRFTGLAAVREGGIAVWDEEPAAPTRVRRTRQRRAAATEAQTGSAVAVLDEEPELDEAEPASDGPAEEADEQPTPRRHTTPEPGTAAERAAARRARLREQQTEGKERS